MRRADPALDQTEEICALGAVELGHLYRKRALSPVEVVDATLSRIEALNPLLNAFVSVTAETARAEARAAEAMFMAGLDLGPLQGVPYSVKDVIRVKGTLTTAASRVLQQAPMDEYDAAVVHLMRAGGAVLVGKTNLHEFAIGAPDPDSPFGVVQNPRGLGCQAGASSSGSAAAVAAGLGVISLGTDTGGSVRHPASLCGLVGLKATHGLTPLGGVIPVSAQLDQVGPLGRSVSDTAACLEAITPDRPNGLDSAASVRSSFLHAVGAGDLDGLRIGVPTNPCYRLCFPDALAVQEAARDQLSELGAGLVSMQMPGAEEVGHLWEVIALVDLAGVHRRIGAQETLYGRHVRQRLDAGNGFSGVQYASALAAKADLRRTWVQAFERVDLMLLPGNGIGAPPHGVETLELFGATYPTRLICSPANRVSSMTGFPAIVVPVGEDSGGRPIAIQLVAPPFGEHRLLAAAAAIEASSGHLTRRWGIAPRGGSIQCPECGS